MIKQFIYKQANETKEQQNYRILNNKEWAKEAIGNNVADYNTMPSYITEDKEIKKFNIKVKLKHTT